MIIAAAVSEKMVHPHFDECNQFSVFNIDDSNISLLTNLDFTGMNYDTDKIAEVLNKLNAKAIFCGSIPKKSALSFMAFDMAVIAGQSGDAAKSLKHYIMHSDGGCSDCNHDNCENCSEECCHK